VRKRVLDGLESLLDGLESLLDGLESLLDGLESHKCLSEYLIINTNEEKNRDVS
jgi:hypothetical protein